MSLYQRRMRKLVILAVTIAAIAGAVLPAFGQAGEWRIGDDDGRLNVDTHMGGANVYCVDRWRQGAITFANGGGFRVVDPQQREMLFVPEATIVAAWETLERTGEYVTLGVSRRAWYNGAPIAIYLLANGEYQINAADEHGKTVEFQWRECRNFTITTDDGCAPSWDRDSTGTCVNVNLY
jgi:hypothetical protein